MQTSTPNMNQLSLIASSSSGVLVRFPVPHVQQPFSFNRAAPLPPRALEKPFQAQEEVTTQGSDQP